jgi:protein O-mannosyl-transferase
MITPRSIVPIAVVGAFFALTFAVHHKVFTAPMLYDSAGVLKANEYLFNSGISQVIKIFPQRPVPMITFYLNYLVDGMNPYYFRVANAFLMACAAGAVVLLLIYLLEIPGITVHGTPSQKRIVSICLGLVFLLHPATIYVVVYVWQRMALMSGLFFFLALASYLATRTGRISKRVAGYAACAVMFFAAIASKENAIALPVILLLVELVFFHATVRDFLKRSVVFGSVLLIAVLALSFVERPHGYMISHGGIVNTIARYYAESGLTPAQVVMGQCVVFFEYLKMVVLPLPSNVHFMSAQLVPSSITDPPITVVGVAGVIAVTATGIFLLRRRPLVAFGTLFFIISLLPEAIMVPQYLFFGYRVFVPMFGLLLVAADGILFLIDLPQSRRGKLAIKVGLTSAVAAALLLLSYATVSKEALWMDPIAFWNDARDRLPLNDNRVEKQVKVQTLNILGHYLTAAGEPGQAIPLHREAMNVDRRLTSAYHSLGMAYSQAGQLDEAAATYRELLLLDDNSADAHAGLGAVLLKQNKLDEALDQFNKAAERKPGHPDFNNAVGTVWLMKHDYSSAMHYFGRTLESNPNHVEAHYNMGKILTDTGKIAEAIDHFNKALAVDPKFWKAHNNLGVIFATMGKLPEAIVHFHKALKVNPGDVATQKNLETALANLGTEVRR